MVGLVMIGIVLVVAAYTVMLALQQKPETPDNTPAELTSPTPAAPETAQSPPG